MKNTSISLIFLSLLWFSSCNGKAKSDNPPQAAVETNTGMAEETSSGDATGTTLAETSKGEVVYLTKAMFLEKVYDYETNPSKWTFKGDQPCIIDFYADWCRPCKMVAPIMDEMAKKYQGKVTVYKVNTDKERELAQFFGIRSIPTILFCPVGSEPQMTQGAMDKANYEKVINEVLLKN